MSITISAGKWWVEVEGQWAGPFDTLADAEAFMDSVESADGFWQANGEEPEAAPGC